MSLDSTAVMFDLSCDIKESWSPSHREIARGLKTTSPLVFRAVYGLRNAGQLYLNADGTIALPLKSDGCESVQVTLMGKIACGGPTLAVENYDGTFKGPSDWIGHGKFFMFAML
jgi:SOS-response transcriptional repressor LexA